MAMPLDRARKVLKSYNDNDMNATVALQKAGYSEQSATKASKVILNRAIRTVAREQLQSLVTDSNPLHKLLQYVQMTPEDVRNEYLYIVKQNKDLTNKLKALQPLLATQGIKWNEEQTNITPTLNLTVKSNLEPSRPMLDHVQHNAEQSIDTDRPLAEPILDNNVNDVSSFFENDKQVVENMAQQSHEIVSVAKCVFPDPINDTVSGRAGVDLSVMDVKEEESRPSNFEEKSTIDTNE